MSDINRGWRWNAMADVTGFIDNEEVSAERSGIGLRRGHDIQTGAFMVGDSQGSFQSEMMMGGAVSVKPTSPERVSGERARAPSGNRPSGIGESFGWATGEGRNRGHSVFLASPCSVRNWANQDHRPESSAEARRSPYRRSEPYPWTVLAAALRPWQPGSEGKGIVSPMGGVILWQTDLSGGPNHNEVQARLGYDRPGYEPRGYVYLKPSGNFQAYDPSGNLDERLIDHISQAHPALGEPWLADPEPEPDLSDEALWDSENWRAAALTPSHACPNCQQPLLANGRAGFTAVKADGTYSERGWECPTCNTDFRPIETRPIQTGGLYYSNTHQAAQQTMYHVAPAWAEHNIAQHGLAPVTPGDWRSYAEEVGDEPSVWLYPEQPTEADDDRWMPGHEHVWAVDTTDLPLIHDPYRGAYRYPEPIEPERLRRIASPTLSPGGFKPSPKPQKPFKPFKPSPLPPPPAYLRRDTYQSHSPQSHHTLTSHQSATPRQVICDTDTALYPQAVLPGQFKSGQGELNTYSSRHSPSPSQAPEGQALPPRDYKSPPQSGHSYVQAEHKARRIVSNSHLTLTTQSPHTDDTLTSVSGQCHMPSEVTKDGWGRRLKRGAPLKSRWFWEKGIRTGFRVIGSPYDRCNSDLYSVQEDKVLRPVQAVWEMPNPPSWSILSTQTGERNSSWPLDGGDEGSDGLPRLRSLVSRESGEAGMGSPTRGSEDSQHFRHGVRWIGGRGHEGDQKMRLGVSQVSCSAWIGSWPNQTNQGNSNLRSLSTNIPQMAQSHQESQTVLLSRVFPDGSSRLGSHKHAFGEQGPSEEYGYHNSNVPPEVIRHQGLRPMDTQDFDEEGYMRWLPGGIYFHRYPHHDFGRYRYRFNLTNRSLDYDDTYGDEMVTEPIPGHEIEYLGPARGWDHQGHRGNFQPWEPGSHGKGILTPTGAPVHWKTDGPDGLPSHNDALNQMGYGDVDHYFYIKPTGGVNWVHAQSSDDELPFRTFLRSHKDFFDEDADEGWRFPQDRWQWLGSHKTAGPRKDPPNYRKGTKAEHCGNCQMFWKGHCWGYGNKKVEAEGVCDSWAKDDKRSNWQFKQAAKVPVRYHGSIDPLNEMGNLKGYPGRWPTLYDGQTVHIGPEGSVHLDLRDELGMAEGWNSVRLPPESGMTEGWIGHNDDKDNRDYEAEYGGDRYTPGTRVGWYNEGHVPHPDVEMSAYNYWNAFLKRPDISPDTPGGYGHGPKLTNWQFKQAAWGLTKDELHPEQQRVWNLKYPSREYEQGLNEFVRNPPPGTRLWRGEQRPIGFDPNEGMGMHWTVSPNAVITPSYPDKGKTPVVWQGTLGDNPEHQMFPRSDAALWGGQHRSMGWEGEVRLRPHTQFDTEGYWRPTRENPGLFHPYPTAKGETPADRGWEFVPVGQRLPILNKGHLPYADLKRNINEIPSSDQLWDEYEKSQQPSEFQLNFHDKAPYVEQHAWEGNPWGIGYGGPRPWAQAPENPLDVAHEFWGKHKQAVGPRYVPDPENPLLNLSQVAQWYGVSQSAVSNWRNRSYLNFPAETAPGLWHPTTVQNWAQGRNMTPAMELEELIKAEQQRRLNKEPMPVRAPVTQRVPTESLPFPLPETRLEPYGEPDWQERPWRGRKAPIYYPEGLEPDLGEDPEFLDYGYHPGRLSAQIREWPQSENPGAWYGRRPVIYDPGHDTLHIGPEGYSHPQVMQSVLNSPGEYWNLPTEIPNNISMGWVGKNPEADHNDYVFNRRTPKEFGWYSITPRPPAATHQTLQNWWTQSQGNPSTARRMAQMSPQVPPEPGSQPIPPGNVRLWHYTQGDPEAIRQQGLMMQHAKGESYGEPNQIWASARPPDFYSKNVVEFHVPRDDPRWNIGKYEPYINYEYNEGGDSRTNPNFDYGQYLHNRGAHVTFHGDIRPDEILGVHEPWHQHYRALHDYYPTAEAGQSAGLDWVTPENEPDLYKAIQAWKNDLWPPKLGVSTPMGFGPMYHVAPRRHREQILQEGLQGQNREFSPHRYTWPQPPGNYMFDNPEDAKGYAFNLKHQQERRRGLETDEEDRWQWPEPPNDFHTWTDEQQDQWHDDNPPTPATEDPHGFDVWKVHNQGMPMAADPESQLTGFGERGEELWDLGMIHDVQTGERTDPWGNPQELTDWGDEPRRYFTPVSIPPKRLQLHEHIPTWDLNDEAEEESYNDKDYFPTPWAQVPMTARPWPGHESRHK